MMYINRRNFVKLSLTALGGTILTGCGGVGFSSATPTPNGYQFYKVMTRGETIIADGERFKIDLFGGSVHLSNNGIITFDAVDENKRKGIFQIGVDLNKRTPLVDWKRVALLIGDELADERVVSSYRSFDVDEHGNIAAVLEADIRASEDHYGAGLYVDVDQTGFEPVLIAGQTFNSGQSMSSGIFGDVSYSDKNVMTSAHHVATDHSSKSDSLMHIPDSNLDDMNILLSSGEIVTETNHTASSFGLIDHNSSGEYSTDVFVANATLARSSERNSQGSVKIKGNVNVPKNLQTRAINADSVVSDGAAYGTRISSNGDIWSIQEINDDMTLFKNDVVIISTGDDTEVGEVLSISPGALGTDGTYYFTAIVQNSAFAATTLFAANGSEVIPILSAADILSENGAHIKDILFGTTTKHVDSENRLAFLCALGDNTTSLIIGIPV